MGMLHTYAHAPHIRAWSTGVHHPYQPFDWTTAVCVCAVARRRELCWRGNPAGHDQPHCDLPQSAGLAVECLHEQSAAWRRSSGRHPTLLCALLSSGRFERHPKRVACSKLAESLKPSRKSHASSCVLSRCAAFAGVGDCVLGSGSVGARPWIAAL
eukprot:362387-Chlamydomonas_euryale.AAC.11